MGTISLISPEVIILCPSETWELKFLVGKTQGTMSSTRNQFLETIDLVPSQYSLGTDNRQI